VSLASKIRDAWGDDAPMMGGLSRLTGVLPTGIDSLDVAIGCGGWPEGRISFLAGPESTGKTNVALLAVKQAQQLGGAALFLDFESKLEGGWAEHIGVKVDDVFLEYPDSIESGLATVCDFAEQLRGHDANVPAVVVWDSLHSAEAAKTVKGELTAGNYGNEAQAYGRGFRRVARIIREKKVVFLAISQIRMSIDGMGNTKEKVGAGRPTLHAAALIVGMKTKEIKPSGDRVPYFEVTANMRPPKGKNQIATGHPECTWAFIPGEGIHEGHALLQAALMTGLATGPNGSTYEITFKGQKATKIRGEFALARKPDEYREALRVAVRATLTTTDIKLVPVESSTNDEGEE